MSSCVMSVVGAEPRVGSVGRNMPSPQWVASRVKGGSAVSNTIYDVFFKRSSSYMATVMVTATFAGIGYDYVMNAIWEWNNKGVRPVIAEFC